MSAVIKKPRPKKADAPVTFTAYKGFNSDLTCRGFQFEIGKTFKHDGPVAQCNSGFHVCQNPLDVLDFYPLIGDDGKSNRFAKVVVGGKVDRSDDKKWAAAELTISCELALPALIADAIKFVKAIAKSGDNVEVASGDYSQLAASGNSSKLAASGNSSQLAASGYSSQLAASGNYSQLAASGDYSQLAASGNSSKLAASGYSSQLAASGNYSKLAASGYSSKLAASGNYSQLAASGNSSKLAASGDYSQLAASGNYSQLAASGNYSVVSASGYNSTATAGKDGAICLAYWDGKRPRFAIGYVGEDGIKAGVAYRADTATGKLVAA
jgi:hypothetical protein